MSRIFDTYDLFGMYMIWWTFLSYLVLSSNRKGEVVLFYFPSTRVVLRDPALGKRINNHHIIRKTLKFDKEGLEKDSIIGLTYNISTKSFLLWITHSSGIGNILKLAYEETISYNAPHIGANKQFIIIIIRRQISLLQAAATI